MKTIEEKAKAYDEAFERAKQIRNGNPSSGTAIVVCEQIFPELAESEDERIRKNLISFLEALYAKGKSACDGEQWSKSDCADWIAYLEKQKEQKVSHLHPEDYPMTPGECISPLGARRIRRI